MGDSTHLWILALDKWKIGVTLRDMESKEVNRRNTRVGTRVQAFTGRTGTVTKVADRTTGQRFAVKVRWDYNGYEGWVSNPGYNLTVK